MSHDFKASYSGVVLEHEFTYTNKGDEDLTIMGIDLSCGCTTAEQWQATLKPGAKSALRLKVDTINLTGPQIKTATIRSNDPKQPSVQIALKAELASPLQIDAPRPNIMQIPMADGKTKSIRKTFTVINQTEKKVTFGEPKLTNASHFKVTVAPQKSGNHYDLTFETIPPYPGGGVMAEFSIPTSLPDMPVLRSSIITIEKPIISAEPAGVMLDRKSKEPQTEATITLRNDSPDAIELLKPTVDANEVALKLETVKKGFEYRLHISHLDKVTKLLAKKSLFIRLATSSPHQPELIIPISGVN